MEYPLPAFRFKVEEINATDPDLGVAFSEVSGLTQEIQVIEYRDGMTPQQSSIKMPGLRKANNVTLKRGITKGNNSFMDWLKTVKLNTISRKTIIISLLDENDTPAMHWQLINAFPVKVEGPSLKATGNEIAIETIELAHEGFMEAN